MLQFLFYFLILYYLGHIHVYIDVMKSVLFDKLFTTVFNSVS